MQSPILFVFVRSGLFLSRLPQLILCHSPFLAQESAGAPPPPVCALYAAEQSACIIAFEAWARQAGLCEPDLPAEHRAWVANEHAKYARKLIRSLKRLQASEGSSVDGGVGDIKTGRGSKRPAGVSTVPQLTPGEVWLAEQLRARFGSDATLEHIRGDEDTLMEILH